MSEAKTPVAIRITRPYASEDEYLAKELDLLTRTGVTLVGAQQRPQGVVLRFEIVMPGGVPLVRGEGRVVAYKENAFEGAPGLALRFTRLDSKSKALVDRAAAMRDARARGGSIPPAAAAPQPPPPPPIAPPPPPLPEVDQEITNVEAREPPRPIAPPLPIDLESTRAEAPQSKSKPPEAPVVKSKPPPPVKPRPLTPLPPPPGSSKPLDLEATRAEVPEAKTRSRPPPPPGDPDRDAILGRLRKRAESLNAEDVERILGEKPRRG